MASDLLKVKGGSALPGVIEAHGSDSENERPAESEQVWHGQSKRIRARLNMPQGEEVWTDKHVLIGVPQIPRFLDVLQVAYWSWLRKHPSAEERAKPVEWWADISQSIERQHWGPKVGCSQKDSLWYSFKLDRVLDFQDRRLSWFLPWQCLL